MFVFGQHLLYKAEEYEIKIFRKALFVLDLLNLLSHLHIRFDNAVGRFKIQKYVTDYNNTRKEISKAIEWTAVKQGHGSLHGENEVQNK